MITALLSFFGGTAFRLIFGAIMDWLNKRQDHQHEMEQQRLQSELEAQRHDRDMARLQLQSQLGIKEVQVQTAAALSVTEANAFLEAVKGTQIVTGFKLVDAWNQSIRPAGATVSLIIWIVTMAVAGFVLREFDEALIAAFLGVFVGERIHSRIRG